MPDAALRWGGPEDLEILCRLNRRCFNEPWSPAALHSALESGYDLLLGESGGVAVAFLLTLRVLDEIQIMQIGVDPKYRRCGLARQMMATLLSDASGVAAVTLEVRRSNRAAAMLYQSLGFTVVGERKGYYATDGGSREDALLMTLVLSE